jgi:NhaP-type Na+/H+ or K+/H+ antiporter
MFFTCAGILMFLLLREWPARENNLGVFLRLAEIGLVLLLFTDASQTDLAVLKGMRNVPMRLLSTGMLLTIILGALGALAIFPQLSLWEAGILAAILAPTDAGLGQIIVSSPRVPLRIRQALNVEAGLNDGLSVPFLMFFIGLAATAAAHRSSLMNLVLMQLGLGAVIGVGIGLIGGWLLVLARDKQWMAGSFEPLGVVALPLLCAVVSEVAGASMFIAAFVAGLAVQVGFKKAGKHSVEFTEEYGQMLNLSVFFLFGLLSARDWKAFTFPFLLYAILSLTVIRMLPVAIALIRTGFSKATVLFMGWFGPRGLASIVLGLVFLEHETQLAGEPIIRLAVKVTVLLSIFAHGLSTQPGINRYAASIASLAPDAPEFQHGEAGNEVGTSRRDVCSQTQ